jgi:metal-responsive CopG/Arc/MetJ family transcriptional regulator
MSNIKERITITIMPSLNETLEKISLNSGVSKSQLVEKAVKEMFKKKLNSDLKKLAKMKFDDLPNEDNWDLIQSKID